MKNVLLFTTLAFASGLSACERIENTPDTSQQQVDPIFADGPDRSHLPLSLENGQAETLATAVNLSGQLCAKVIGAMPMDGRLYVECSEYRNRSDEKNTFVRYFVSGYDGAGEVRVIKVSELGADGWHDTI